MPKVGRIIHSDATLLRMLDLREEGLSKAKIAARLRMTRGSVIGALYRIDQDTDAADLTPHRNGEEKPRWWKAGLAKQREAADA